MTGTLINAYSVRMSSCTTDIVYWRHSIIHHRPFTQGHTVRPTDNIVKYTTNKHTENWHHVYLCSLMLMAITVKGQDSTKEEATCSWKLCYSKQFFSPFELHLYNKTLLGIIVYSSQKTIKIRLKLTQVANCDWKSTYKKNYICKKSISTEWRTGMSNSSNWIPLLKICGNQIL